MDEQLILNTALTDLQNDLTEEIYIIKSNLDLIKEAETNTSKIKKFLSPESNTEFLRLIGSLKKKYSSLLSSIQIVKNDVNSTYHKLSSVKKNSYTLLRIYQGILAATLTSLDWQSPSFDYSYYSEAGSQTGKIIGTINDYKRDRHLDEEAFENKFLKEYIDRPAGFGMRALLTSSGMSAFTTVFNFLLGEQKLNSFVLVGKSSYFQYKGIIQNTMKGKMLIFDEVNTSQIVSMVKQTKPGVMFIDTLSNSADIPVPDLPEIFKQINSHCSRELYIIIDNTTLSIFCQPFAILKKRNKNIHLIVFESLIKYIHLGLDRSTGGIIIASGKDAYQLFEYRKNLGTNITDSSVYCFPRPNREILKKRLLRFHRNATFLALKLDEYIKNTDTPVVQIIYPNIDHGTYLSAKLSLPFSGSFLNLKFKEPYQSVSFYKNFIRRVISNAREKNVDILAGTSFGLNTTRIYLTSLWSDYGEPFIRISVGTEDRIQIEKVVHVVNDTLKHSNSIIPSRVHTSVNKLKKKIGINRLV